MPGMEKKRTRTTQNVSDTSFDLGQDFSIRLKRARNQLVLLREQEEQIEREKRELEGLKTQTEELDGDKREISTKLADAITMLEREEEETRRKQQEVVDIRKEFETLIREIKVAEKRGQKGDVRQQMAVEREVVEKARESFDRARKKLEGLLEEVEEEIEEEEPVRPVIDLVEGFKVGIGFFLAGALLTTVLYVVYLMIR